MLYVEVGVGFFEAIPPDTAQGGHALLGVTRQQEEQRKEELEPLEAWERLCLQGRVRPDLQDLVPEHPEVCFHVVLVLSSLHCGPV